MQLKRADNLKLIYETGLADFLEKELFGNITLRGGGLLRGANKELTDGIKKVHERFLSNHDVIEECARF